MELLLTLIHFLTYNVRQTDFIDSTFYGRKTYNVRQKISRSNSLPTISTIRNHSHSSKQQLSNRDRGAQHQSIQYIRDHAHVAIHIKQFKMYNEEW